MISEQLFNEVLINPCKEKGYNSLLVVSGYGTPSFAHHHLEKLKNDVNVKLVVGMTPKKGVSQIQHTNFVELTNRNKQFKCFYIPENMPPVHAKIYIWMKDLKPKEAFCGSVNYSANGFLSSQLEVVTKCDENIAFNIFNNVHEQAISCLDPLANRLEFLTDNKIKPIEYSLSESFSISTIPQYVDLPLFVEAEDRIHSKSALNWGQREGREPNQAYIPIPSRIGKTGFFPQKTEHFSVLTNEGFPIICSVAQENNKAIHTPHNNSILGEYFRNKLGVPLGKFVTMEDLNKYGKKYVRFIKLDEEEYLMDF